MNRIFYILIFATTLGTISGCFVDVPNPEDGTFLCHDDGDCADGYSCWDSVCQKSPDDGNDTDDRQCYNHGDCEADQNIEPELTYCAPDGFCKDPCDGQNCEENLICVRDLNASGAAHCADCSESGCLNNLEVCVDSTDGARCVPGCGHSDCAASSICYQVDGYSQPNVPSQISVCLDCPTSCDTGMMCGVSDATTTSYDYASTTCICDENSCPGLGVGYHCTDPTTSGINECTDYCGSDSDCSSGFACVDNFCERPICNENIECNAGEICRISSVDDTSKILSHCITNPCVPARCQTDETCAITLYGEQVFECLHIPPIGNSCFRNDECLNGGECFRAPDSGYFVHGFCAKSCGNDTECGTGEDCLNFQLSEYSSWYGACIESPGDALAECNYGCANGSACVEDKFSGQPYCRDETCRTDTDCDVGLECVHNPWRPDSNGSYGSCFETEATAGSCPTQSTVTTYRLSNDTDTQICDKGTLGACEYSGCTKMNDVCALLPTGYFGCTPVCDAMSPSPCFDGEECVAVWALPSDGTSRDLQLDHDVCIPIDGLRYGNDVTATSSGDTFWRLGEEPALSFYDDIEGYPFGGDASAWPVKMEKAGKVVATWFNDGSTKFFDADSLLEMNNSASTPCKTNARVLSVGDEEIGNAGAATGAWVLAECTSEQFGNDMLCPSLMFTPAESMVT
ncbi:hypothetical protein KAI87_01185, partial [Myxococcota bacterium]|nr:hypothetical protein [Myxococcota bacterium]